MRTGTSRGEESRKRRLCLPLSRKVRQCSKQQRVQRIVLLFTFLLLCILPVCSQDNKTGPKEIWIDVEHVKRDSLIPVQFRNIAPSEVEACTWYVGERQVSKTKEITSFTPKEGDEEQFIRVEVAFTDGSICEDSFYYSILPVLYLESEMGYKDVYWQEGIYAQIRLAAGEGYLPTEAYEGGAFIHLRGNSTNELDKRPFKLKLDKKSDLLGMGKSKHWVLLANAIDATLLRNRLMQEFARDIGADVWMDSKNVTLIYNGEYQGVYELCEQVRIDENRVDVYDWEEVCEQAARGIAGDLTEQGLAAEEERPFLEKMIEADLTLDFSWMEDAAFTSDFLKDLNESTGRNLPVSYDLHKYIDMQNLPEAVGGVLMEMSQYHKNDASLKTNYDMPIYFNRPSQGATYRGLLDYMREYLQTLEYAFHETDFTYHEDSPHYQMSDPGWYDQEKKMRLGVEYKPASFSAEEYDGLHYSELIDFDSLLNNFLICEFSVNYDGMKNSVFFYKDVDGKLFIGPPWDYDWAWGNSYSDRTIQTWCTDIWQTTDEYFGRENYYQSVQWNRCLIRDPYFVVRVYEKYWEIRETVIEEMVREGGLIDTYAAELKPAADANDARWGGSMGDYTGRKFNDSIADVKSFLKQRISWLDEQFASVETLCASLGYYQASDNLTVQKIDTASRRGMTRIQVSVELPECKEVAFQINGAYIRRSEVQNGIAELWVSNRELRTGKGELNAVQVRAVDKQGEYIRNLEGTVEGEYCNAVSNYGWFVWNP